jgi:hypothetical protein
MAGPKPPAIELSLVEKHPIQIPLLEKESELRNTAPAQFSERYASATGKIDRART